MLQRTPELEERTEPTVAKFGERFVGTNLRGSPRTRAPRWIDGAIVHGGAGANGHAAVGGGMGEREDAWEVKCAGEGSGDAQTPTVAGTVFYAVRGARADEVIEVPTGCETLSAKGECRGPFFGAAEAEAALAEMVMGDFINDFGTDGDACEAGESTATGIGSTAAADTTAAKQLSLSVEATSRHVFHVQVTTEGLHCTAKLHSLLRHCPEMPLSAAADGQPTFSLESHSKVVRWLRAHSDVAHVDDIPQETVRALHCYNSKWTPFTQDQVDNRRKQMASFAPRLAKLLLRYQTVGVTSAIRFDGRMLLYIYK